MASCSKSIVGYACPLIAFLEHGKFREHTDLDHKSKRIEASVICSLPDSGNNNVTISLAIVIE